MACRCPPCADPRMAGNGRLGNLKTCLRISATRPTMVDAPQSPYSTISKSGYRFAAHHGFKWHFLADWVLKKNISLSYTDSPTSLESRTCGVPKLSTSRVTNFSIYLLLNLERFDLRHDARLLTTNHCVSVTRFCKVLQAAPPVACMLPPAPLA